MIIGVGTDMVELPRIARAIKTTGLADKLFTAAEIDMAEGKGQRKVSTLAGCFAAKEAVVKAIGTGFAGCWPNEVEILRDAVGKPTVTLFGKIRALADERGIEHIHISISNTAAHALAFAVAEGVLPE